jgi:polyhydroxybutyrate depolymerase
VVGALFGGEAPPQAPTPAFIIVGAEDAIVPPGGGPLQLRAALGNRSAADKDTAPAIAQAEYWAKANGCGEATTTTTPAATTTRWSGCRAGADVVYHVVADNGHAWPGGRPGRQGADPPSAAFNASEEMWAFFRTKTRG